MSNENLYTPLYKIAHKVASLYSTWVKTERRDLLWENPEPLNAFDAQTISLNLEDYSFIEVEFFPYDYTGQQDTFDIKKIRVGEKGYLDAIIGTTGKTTGNFASFRRDLSVTTTGIVFEAVYFSNGGGAWGVYANKTGCVPYKIYGIKTIIGGNSNGLTGVLGGPVIANSNSTSMLETKQVRNITISTEKPTNADGNDGDIWIIYEESD